MTNKLDELKISVQSANSSVILITETWLTQKIPDTLLNIPGYQLYRKDRATNGGGLCIFVRNVIAGHRVSSALCHSLSTTGPVESIWVEINVDKSKFLVACVYRPKRATSVEQNQELLHVLEKAMSLAEPVYIFGDFNYPEINWNTLTVSPCDRCSLDFLDGYRSHRGEQMIRFPTRVRKDEISLLDLLLVNDKKLVFDIQEHAPLGRSDHVVITAKTQLHLPVRPTHTVYKREFWTADYESVNSFLSQQDFRQQEGTHGGCENLMRALTAAIDIFVPYKPRKVNTRKPWLSTGIFREIQRKRKLWHKYRSSKTEESYSAYRIQSNKTKSCIEQARKKYEHNLLNSSEKQFYAYVSRNLNSRLVSFNLVDKSTNTQIKTEEEMAECFAEQFQSVYSRGGGAVGMPLLPDDSYSRSEIDRIAFTPEKVDIAIRSLKLDSSPGPDGIPAVFLSRCAGSLCGPLSMVFNDILETGHFPDAWKNAVVIPIYKKGDKRLAENYRPISLTSTLCKCMEKIVVKELTAFFLDAQIIPPEQHGFLPRRSTFTNLLTRLQQWTLADDDHQPVDVVYLDFEKAFDKILITSLIYKLEHYGVRGKLLQLISGFLEDRKFQVRVGSEMSKEYSVYSGVPQGSVLGPLLFIVYLSDLYTGLKTNVSSFADDTNIFCNPLLESACLQHDLNAIKTWTGVWGMPLNDSKCTVLHIGYNNPKQAYYFNQTKIAEVQSQRDLGVIVSDNLKWDQHITHIVKRANTLIYLIRKSFKDHSSETILKLYKSFVRPKIEYAHCIWSPYYSKDIEQLERVQRRVTKIPVELRCLPYESRLCALRLTTLRERRMRGDLIETYKIVSGHYGCNIEIFQFNQAVNLRGHNKKLSKERCNKLLRRNFLTNRVVYSWNRLEAETISSETTNQFKNRLDVEMRDWNGFFVHYM